MTDLNRLYSDKRTGIDNPTNNTDPRTEYQRDYDRIIFSSSFRRLQNKTQVFPLPGSVFVHNRLTHSLEVSSVGRSLGTLIGAFIANKFKSDLSEESIEFYKHSLYNVIAAACLCHDIGNPAFGHSGEDAIASFFVKNVAELGPLFSPREWSDLINFEGNANAIRILTQQQHGKAEGGFRLTSSTLASIAKYPCESIAKQKGITHRKKFGYFQTEKKAFEAIVSNTGMIQESADPVIYRRHPFVWLVEAADDICYNIIDLEDAHRLGIIAHTECIDLLLFLVEKLGVDNIEKVKLQLSKINDKNDQFSYLRAKSINTLTMKSVDIYQQNFDRFLDGSFSQPLFDVIKADCEALGKITEYSIENIYNHRSVVEIENAGYNVMYNLLSHFVLPILKDKKDRDKSEEKAVKLIPAQFLYETGSPFEKVLGIIDYVSGMTDNYATDLYRKIKGIEIGMSI
ncbi:MAG: dNTP triphosphohydrolase [Chitinophagaceae bacterium]